MKNLGKIFCKDFLFNRGVEASERRIMRKYVSEQASEDNERQTKKRCKKFGSVAQLVRAHP